MSYNIAAVRDWVARVHSRYHRHCLRGLESFNPSAKLCAVQRGGLGLHAAHGEPGGHDRVCSQGDASSKVWPRWGAPIDFRAVHDEHANCAALCASAAGLPRCCLASARHSCDPCADQSNAIYQKAATKFLGPACRAILLAASKHRAHHGITPVSYPL
jgi:hypothetical protein